MLNGFNLFLGIFETEVTLEISIADVDPKFTLGWSSFTDGFTDSKKVFDFSMC